MTTAADRAREQARPERENLRHLRLASLAEGTTLLLLVCVAVPLRHLGGYRAATAVMGSVHGMAFLIFAWLTINAAAGGGWGARETARLLLAACIPFGGFLNARVLKEKEATLGAAGEAAT